MVTGIMTDQNRIPHSSFLVRLLKWALNPLLTKPTIREYTVLYRLKSKEMAPCSIVEALQTRT